MRSGQLMAAVTAANALLPSDPSGNRALCVFPKSRGPSGVDRAIAQAIYLASHGDRAESDIAATVIERALAVAPAGNAGWLLPVEPMLAIASCPTPWLGVLARLRSRAAWSRPLVTRARRWTQTTGPRASGTLRDPMRTSPRRHGCQGERAMASVTRILL
jgi:hypothetical protein